MSWIGSEAYQLLNRLNAGQSLDDTGYIQLVQLLNQHFLKPTHIIAARYSFHQCEMGPNNTYATWLVNLKDNARLCRFFNQTITNECQAIEERIRDHIVMKTPHDHVRNTMLQMKNPTLDDQMRFCKTRELIQGTQQLVQCRSTEFGQSMTMKRETDQIDLIRSTNKYNDQACRATNKPQSSCTRCGRQHTRFQRCPATGKTCKRCGKIGHFEACCRSTNTPTHNNVRAVEMVSDNDSEILRSINTIGHDDIIPIIKVQINGQCINIKFDIGASVSIISRAVWQHIGEPTLHPAKVLKTYGGQVLQSIGKCLPKSVITIREHEINSSPLCSIKATYENNEELYNLLQNCAEVFGPRTTHVKDYEVELTIDTNAIPHCWGSRRVPFSLRESVEAELQRQLKQGVIEPVDTSQEIVDWAAPIVVTHKSDGSSATQLQKSVELSGRRAIWSWKPEHTQAFEKVKESLMDARILKNFDIHKDVHLTCDASDNCLGAILFQEDSNHVKLPVAYASRTLKPNEKDYAQVEKEGLAIVFARIVIPRSIRYKAWETLHLGHPGISAMRHLARLYCLKQQPKSAHQPLHQWDVPAEVWTRIHVDFAGPIDGQMYLALIDAQSHWPEIIPGSTGKAPAELLYGRRLKTIWDRLRPTTQTTVQSHREKQKERHDVNARPRQFDVHQAVLTGLRWGSYVVNTQNGERRRHADDLRTNKEVNTNIGVTEITGSEELNDHIPSETIRRGTRCRKNQSGTMNSQKSGKGEMWQQRRHNQWTNNNRKQ
ncbi:hypothetical protein GJ496_009574 [Pomphorhynchus laevis]|nr:hypothetical protein GJ496_009574 [Pomphorhynchus laevis]